MNVHHWGGKLDEEHAVLLHDWCHRRWESLLKLSSGDLKDVGRRCRVRMLLRGVTRMPMGRVAGESSPRYAVGLLAGIYRSRLAARKNRSNRRPTQTDADAGPKEDFTARK